MSVQCVEKHLNPDPNWPSTAFRRMRRRNVTNVEICSKKQTLQGILRFIQAEVVCWHVKNVERLSTERTVFANMWTDSMKKLQSTNVVTARKLFLKNGTWRSTWLFTQELHGSSANTVRRISHLNLICIVMWRNATMSFQEFHFPFHNDRRSWRQHFLSMNRGGKADWYNVDLPFLLQGLGPSFCSIPQYWPLKILLIFVFQYGDFGGGVRCAWIRWRFQLSMPSAIQPLVWSSSKVYKKGRTQRNHSEGVIKADYSGSDSEMFSQGSAPHSIVFSQFVYLSHPSKSKDFLNSLYRTQHRKAKW